MARNPAIERHIDKLFPELEHALDAGEAVAEALVTLGWAHVEAVLDAEIDAISAHMEGASVLSRAEYAYRHGRIGGLKAVKQAAEAIIDRANARRDEQEARHEAGAESPAGR